MNVFEYGRERHRIIMRYLADLEGAGVPPKIRKMIDEELAKFRKETNVSKDGYERHIRWPKNL